jgi:hypothetical protein
MRCGKFNLLVFNVIFLGFSVAPLCRLSGEWGDLLMVVIGNYRNRAELRKKPRQFHYDANILSGKDTPPLACSIADISESGARLNLENNAELPDNFILLLTAIGGARRQCRVIWRDGATVGVKFPDNR